MMQHSMQSHRTWSASVAELVVRSNGCFLESIHGFIVSSSARLDQLAACTAHVQAYRASLATASLWPLCEGACFDVSDDESSLELSDLAPPSPLLATESPTVRTVIQVIACPPQQDSQQSQTVGQGREYRSRAGVLLRSSQQRFSAPLLGAPSPGHQVRMSKSQSPAAKKRTTQGSRLVHEFASRPRAHSVGPCENTSDPDGPDAVSTEDHDDQQQQQQQQQQHQGAQRRTSGGDREHRRKSQQRRASVHESV